MKLIFPESVLLIMVIGKWSPALYLNPSYFPLPVLLRSERVAERASCSWPRSTHYKNMQSQNILFNKVLAYIFTTPKHYHHTKLMLI